MDTEDVVVRLVDLPSTIAGYTATSPDGMYNVYLNARYSCEMQRETLRHELRHIKNGDFESDEPVIMLEVK